MCHIAYQERGHNKHRREHKERAKVEDRHGLEPKHEREVRVQPREAKEHAEREDYGRYTAHIHRLPLQASVT